jgi:formylglycine-generating enzyme required for sulfatase activity
VTSGVRDLRAAPDDREDPLIGAVLPGRFRVDARIAAGTFGVVYRGHQLTVDREVAIKVLHAEVEAQSEHGRLFIQEVQAVARIDHPHVVRVYQADVTADGRLFFAMELLAGDDLQARVERGRTPVAVAVRLVRQLLAALEAAHRAGLVHADIKPANAIELPAQAGERLVLVDFGLARLRAAETGAPHVGGTPSYMAPEQLADELIDARTDQFAAALVLVALVCGWRRTRALDVAPPAEVLAEIEDAVVRDATARALSLAPADRFPSAAAFAAALSGEAQVALPPPFHGLAPFTERDRGRLHGRERELLRLTEVAMFRRLMVLTAPSGVGKTSLLRAGLVPRLEALGSEARYLSCRTDAVIPEPAALSEGSATARRVVVVDQVETALDADGDSLLTRALALARRPEDGAELCVVLSVREDHLARLLDRLGEQAAGLPMIRIGPLAPAGAREAITRPLAERQLAISEELLDRLLADLVAAGARLGAELGWGTSEPIYPPHLQLACTALHDNLPEGERTLTLAHYQALGGFDAIVGEHLERVLDSLGAASAVARDVFLALVTEGAGRAALTDEELTEAVPAAHRPQIPQVLEHLRREGLVVRTRRAGGAAVWELVHDSLVPRVHSWIDRRDLSRRRAVELVRHHVRHSRPDAISLISRAELRDIAPHASAVDELDAEWASVPRAEGAWGPSRLVARSRQLHRRTALAAIGLVATVLAVIGAAVYERARSAAGYRAEIDRRDRNLGLVELELAPFDWDVARGAPRAVGVDALPDLRWQLHAVAVDPRTGIEGPGAPFASGRFRLLSSRAREGGNRIDLAEAAGGPAFLVITGRGRSGETCAPSILPIRALPGYAEREDGPVRHRIAVPTCQATNADLITIPAGPFYYGGVGEPPSQLLASEPELAKEQLITLPAYRIARTETTNAQFATLAAMVKLTSIKANRAFQSIGLEHASEPERPVVFLDWDTSRRFCLYWGRSLPTSAQWQKALRGPAIVDGVANRRTFAWKGDWKTGAARVRTARPGVALPCTHPLDISIYGVCDLVGNVQEWTLTSPPGADNSEDAYVVRGAMWESDEHGGEGTIADWAAIENPRVSSAKQYSLGFRCVTP